MLVCEIDIVSRDIDITKVSICTINGRVNCSSHTRLLLLSRLSNTQKLNKYTKIVISYLYILLTYKIHHRLLLHQLVRYCSLRKHLEEQKLFLSTKNTSYKKTNLGAPVAPNPSPVSTLPPTKWNVKSKSPFWSWFWKSSWSLRCA